MVTEELLVPDNPEAGDKLAIRSGAFIGAAVEQVERHVGRLLPFAPPLRLQGCRNDQQSPLDSAGTIECVAGRDGLGRLSEPHVVGQQEAGGLEEPANAFALIGIESPLDRAKGAPQPGRVARARLAQRHAPELFTKESHRHHVCVRFAAFDPSQQIANGPFPRVVVYERLRIEASAAILALVAEGDSCQTISGACERADRIPRQGRALDGTPARSTALFFLGAGNFTG